jgi:cytochrome c oxidase assembly protein subunit 15
MAVPDWPNTYGYNMFFFPISKWVGGIFYEHTHRLLGTVVGLLVLVLMIWLHGSPARPWLRRCSAFLTLAGLGWAAFTEGRRDWALIAAGTGAVAYAVSFGWPRCAPASTRLRWLGNLVLIGVILQGVLGGLRVVLMQDALGVFHATLAQILLFLVCAVALLTSPWWHSTIRSWSASLPPQAASLRGVILGATLLIFFQLILGASMRHRHAVPDFPLAYGRLWPAMDESSIARYNRERPELNAVNPLSAADLVLHMAHRITGFAVVALLTVAAIRTRRCLGPQHALTRGAQAWMGLGYVQLLLGAITVWSNKSADLTTAHVAVGSALMAGGGLLVMLAWRNSGGPAATISDPSLDLGPGLVKTQTSCP